MTAPAPFLPAQKAWCLSFPTVAEACAEARHTLESCPDVDIVMISPASQQTVWTREPVSKGLAVKFATAMMFAADLRFPNYVSVTRDGGLHAQSCVRCGAPLTHEGLLYCDGDCVREVP